MQSGSLMRFGAGSFKSNLRAGDRSRKPMTRVAQVSEAADMAHVRRLFEEYAAEIGIDLCFQNFQQELVSLPGSYAPPSGRLFLAHIDGALGGCIGLRPFSTSE